MKSRLVLTGTLLGLVGCVADNPQIFRGHLVIDPEVETFAPCPFSEPLWLDVPLAVRDKLEKQHAAFQSDPYDDSFMVVEGTLGPQLDCGFCEGYKGSFKLMKIIEHRASTPQDCKK